MGNALPNTSLDFRWVNRKHLAKHIILVQETGNGLGKIPNWKYFLFRSYIMVIYITWSYEHLMYRPKDREWGNTESRIEGTFYFVDIPWSYVLFDNISTSYIVPKTENGLGPNPELKILFVLIPSTLLTKQVSMQPVSLMERRREYMKIHLVCICWKSSFFFVFCLSSSFPPRSILPTTDVKNSKWFPTVTEE